MSVPGLKSGVPSSICGVPRGVRPPVNVDAGTNGAEEPAEKSLYFSGTAHERPPQEVAHPPYGGPVRLKGG